MSFMYNYKRLEQLCGDLLNDDRCISAYIDRMYDTPDGARLVKGWRDDLKQLKHYRWIRNRIAHEPNCSEAEMCDLYDIEWIINFHNRIINQNDPLALYRKATQPKITIKPRQDTRIKALKSENNYPKNEETFNILVLLFIIFIIWTLIFILL